MSRANVKLAQRVLGAFNQKGARAIGEFLDPEIEVHSPAEAPEAGSFKGRAAVLDRLAMLTEPWQELRFEAEEFIDLGGERLVVVAGVKGRGGASGAEVQMRLVQILRIS